MISVLAAAAAGATAIVDPLASTVPALAPAANAHSPFGAVGMIVVLTLSTGLVREKEQATIEQLLVTPISRFARVLG